MIDKNRLRQLAGLKPLRESGDYDEVDLQHVADAMFDMAESNAFQDAQPGGQAVTGDAIQQHYLKIRELVDGLVAKEIEEEYSK